MTLLRSTRLLLLLLASLLSYLAGNASMSLWDRDEPRYAQATREMLRGSPEHPGRDFVVPRFLGEPRTAKPPLIYWLQASAMSVLGENSFAARLPSGLAMAATLAVLAIAVGRETDRRRGLWAAFVLGTSVMAVISAKSCVTDAVLLLWVTLAHIGLYSLLRGRRPWASAGLLAAGIGLAGLTKGPVVFGVLGMTLLALAVLGWFDRKRTGTQPIVVGGRPQLLGLIAAAVVVGIAISVPWMLAVEARSPGFLGVSLGHDVIRRIKTGLEGHSGPPGYHLLTVWGTFFPWSILLPISAMTAWRHRHLPLTRYALAATLGPWVMFELVQTKLPHYLLPMFPAMAILVADAVVRCLDGEQDDLVRPRAVWAYRILGLLLVFAALAIAFYGPYAVSSSASDHPEYLALGPMRDAFANASMLLGLAIFVGAIVIDRAFTNKRPARGLVVLALGVWLVSGFAATRYFPNLPDLNVSRRVAQLLIADGATVPGQVIMQDYKEPSLAFYQGGTIRQERANVLTAELVEKPWQWIVTTQDATRDTDRDVLDRLVEVGRVRGLAYADSGRDVTVIVYRKR